MKLKDTIAAVSTPPGRGGIGIVRISGPEARAIAGKTLRFSHGADWRPWSATLAELPDAEGHSIDHVVVTYFAAPRSYTAEDVIEISCHGSPVVLRFALRQHLRSPATLKNPEPPGP
jgi:tRNA modification GTPase